MFFYNGSDSFEELFPVHFEYFVNLYTNKQHKIEDLKRNIQNIVSEISPQIKNLHIQLCI